MFYSNRSDIHQYNLACHHHPRWDLHTHIQNHTLLSPRFQSSRSLGPGSAGRYYSDIHHYNPACRRYLSRCPHIHTHTRPHLFCNNRSGIHRYNQVYNHRQSR